MNVLLRVDNKNYTLGLVSWRYRK